MARTVLSPVRLSDRNEFSAPVANTALAAAVDATSLEAELMLDFSDEKCLILVQNAGTSAADVTVKAGNGIQGVNDLVHSVAASSFAILAIDSGRFKHVSGEEKGKVIFKGGSANIKIAVFKMP
ncbi:MAG: hypothetical protein IJ344_01385 [Clostridia bacterium]|nr:hypothetical protein [Clostridia bacterium]